MRKFEKKERNLKHFNVAEIEGILVSGLQCDYAT